MSTAVIQHMPERFELISAQALTARLALIQDTMTRNMKVGVDFGKIPGTPKPTLFKPGAEKLCATFRIAPSFETEDLSSSDCIRVRVTCVGKEQDTQIVLGAGLGECSSDESKYKWRAPVCAQEFDETPVDRRREKWMKGRDGKPYKAKQVRTEMADIANTILKMAAKRAQVAMALNVTGASAIFGQDLEDLPDELRPVAADDAPRNGSARRQQPAPRRDVSPTLVTEGQLKILRGKMGDAGMSEEQLCTRFSIAKLEELHFDDLNAALGFVADPQLEASKP